MSKFCGNCGTELPDEAVVCSNCGCNLAPVAAQPDVATPGENAVAAVKDKTNEIIGKVKTDSKFRNLIITIAGGVVAAVVLIVVLVSVFAGGYKKAIDNYIDAFIFGEYDAYKACYPEKIWKNLEDDATDKSEFKDSFKIIKEELKEEYGKDIKVNYEILDKDEVDADDLDDIRDYLKETFNIPKKSVTAAYEIEVKLTIEGDEDEDEDTTDFTLVKIDGDWYQYDFLKSAKYRLKDSE